jgi:hypothetical protein
MRKCLKFDNKKYGNILVAISVFIAGALFLGNFLPALIPGHVDPRAGYKSNFSVPLQQIRNLKGGGMWWRGNGDVWLCFETDRDVVPITYGDERPYAEIPIEEAQAYFRQLLSDKHLLKYLDALNDLENLKCWHAVDSESKNDLWFLTNIKKETYYFREWSYSKGEDL